MVYADTAKWSDLQAEVKIWITHNRNNGTSVSTKITVFLSKKTDDQTWNHRIWNVRQLSIFEET
jgi:hypothetical protein